MGLIRRRREKQGKRLERASGLDRVLDDALRSRREGIGRLQVRSIRSSRRATFKTGIVLLVIFGTPLILVLGPQLLTGLLYNTSCTASIAKPVGLARIALIDSVGDVPNPGIVSIISELATRAGYGFDYYPFGTASVEMFFHLPEKGYAVILLRTHANSVVGAMTTSDPYSQNRYVGYQLSDSLAREEVNGTLHEYFSLTPKFIGQTCGNFHGALILSLGCSTMHNTGMAAAFVEKGARAFVGWDNSVTLGRTDSAFEMLLQLLIGGKTLNNAVQMVMGTYSPDQTYESQLQYYPGTESSLVLQ